MIDEKGLLEMHGVWAPSRDKSPSVWVSVAEYGADRICLNRSHEDAYLTADGALRLASHLRRLARRVKARNP